MANISGAHFFDEIENNYGARSRKMLKNYANHTRKLSNMISRKSFLIRCRRRGVFPAHFASNFRFTFPLLEENGPFSNKVQKCISKFMKSILNLEIKQTFHKIKTFRSRLTALAESIRTSGMPEQIIASFFDSQEKFYERNVHARTNSTKRKFRNIIARSAQHARSEELPSLNPKAIHNGTQVDVPPEAQVLLSLGPKFALPIDGAENVPLYHLLAT